MTAANTGPGAEAGGSTPTEQPRAADDAATRSCATCGNDNPADARFCESCGAPVEAVETPSSTTCPHCGSSNRRDALFCEACGGAVQGTEPSSPGRQPRTGLLIALIALLIAAVIGGAVAAIVLLTRGGSSQAAAPPTTTAAATTAASTTPTQADFPNADESALLAHVPSQIAPSCGRKTGGPDAVAGVFCTPRRPDIGISYYQFSGRDAMARWYAGEVDYWEIRRDTGSCQTSDFTAEFDYTISGVPAGRYLCAVDRDGSPWMEWTDVRLDIGVEAFRQDSRGDLLWRAWKCCLGPNQ